MKCPQCMGEEVTPIGDTHYMCRNCQRNGRNTQFQVVIDETIMFPYNQIFVDRSVNEFYRMPYLS